MAKKEKNKKQIQLVILIIIFCSLLYEMYVSLSTWVLVIFGDSVVGTVDSYNSRLDEIRSEQNRSRTISKAYYFFVGRKEYTAYVIYNSDESWADLDKGETRAESITYLPICPYINKPSMLVDLNKMSEFAIIYHIIVPVGYILLSILIIKSRKKRKKKIQIDQLQ